MSFRACGRYGDGDSQPGVHNFTQPHKLILMLPTASTTLHREQTQANTQAFALLCGGAMQTAPKSQPNTWPRVAVGTQRLARECDATSSDVTAVSCEASNAGKVLKPFPFLFLQRLVFSLGFPAVRASLLRKRNLYVVRQLREYRYSACVRGRL